MIEQAIDFQTESDEVFSLLERLPEQSWECTTQFKNWTINDVIAHLHFGNYLADLSLQDSAAFLDCLRNFVATSKQLGSNVAATHAWLDGVKNRRLLERWREFYRDMAERFAVADPKKRVKWAGPDMSVRSSITARLMETWAHSQAVYDVLGKARVETDRIKNIAVIGINTFGWTFANRGLAIPPEMPYVRLTGPSGAVWEWNHPNETSRIAGSAVEFCQVVTQVRHVADTTLRVIGETANSWMSIAQCFAGPPENPPAPGTRFTQL
ncbi:MAG: TIGR03084 family metal-binding protein [Candidatus Binatia bacterium]